MQPSIDLTRLPRSVRLGRDADGRAEFTYLDERLLPGEECFCSTGSWRCVVDAIKTLAVRGAPAIGAAGAAAVALWAVNEGARGAVLRGCSEAGESFLGALGPVVAEISAVRPTAVN
ncbi:MAG: S-methyl-5-thioribose-1-phosphate isomerase, partial [Ellagibacter isourolithinifaciens]|nr:S-methyl-5-thioribose-1-phosphate isomerase [Ellagibacter isourolithinifaciens]